MNGIINLYKPKGITSSDAVSKAKRILQTRTIGHMGTLDPAGEGVLLLGVGKGAKLFNHYLKKDKLYQAEFTFSYQTDTLDGEGEVILTSEKYPTKSEIEFGLKKLEGKQAQMPPDYSAKSINGVRAYQLARQGKKVELKASDIEIYSAKLLDYKFKDDVDGSGTAINNFSHGENALIKVCNVLIHCSSGTYIRSVCRDLALLCGTYGTMTAIKRIRSGEFLIEDSITIDSLQLQGKDALISLDIALKNLPSVKLDSRFKQKLDNGVRLNVDEVDYNIKSLSDFTLYCDGILYGIARAENDKIIIKTYLKD